MKKTTHLMFLVGLFLVNALSAQETEKFDFDLSQLDIPYQKFVLSNGLTLIVHEDHKAPIAAVNVWYHVGSKNEKFGKTGFAHLFEHLMFNGSENFDDDYFQAMERIGATDLNGTTNFDRTNYFQNVPKSALDVALWMESDRMGHFKDAISQEKLDEQRGVVQNEKRQGENQPYGKFFDLVTQSCFPNGHPYNHTVIGSMEDLNAAALDDVKQWFNDYYGAANAVVVIAGDVNTEEIYQKVVDYFGDIPSGPPVTHYGSYVAKRTGEIRQVQQDRVPQSRIYMVWNVPEWGNPDAFNLDFVADALASGKNSRLYKRLVYDEQIATSVSAYNWENEIAGIFVIQANVKPGVDNMVVENAIKEELAKFLKEGPTSGEMKRIKTDFFAGFTRGIERIGGFGGKSDILAMNAVYGGSPDFYKTRLKGMKEASISSVKSVANKWLSDGVYVLHINPFPDYETTGKDVDRSALPEVGPAATVAFPKLERATLSNGMKVVLAQRNTVPLIEFRMIFDAGYAADQYAKAGTANLTMDMLDEGTKARTALQINEELALLGAELNTGANLDQSYVTLSSLKNNFDQSLALFADVVLNPAFPQADFERLQKQQIVGIQNEKKSPVSMALRTLPKFLYGEDHAYGSPLTGSGYESTVSAMTREDLMKFYETWFKPNNATIVAVGDITMDDLKQKLELNFKKWKSGEVPKKNLEMVGAPNKNKIYVMDKPDALQSVIITGHLTKPYGEVSEIGVSMMNNILGGEFTSRVNMNLREDKGWAYGAFTFLYSAKGQRPFLAYAPVQTDQTAPSMKEIMGELTGYIGDNPATKEEFEKTKTNEILSLPGQWETMNAVEGSIANIVRYGLADDYYQTYAGEVQSLELSKVQKLAKEIIDPQKMTWLVVGDSKKIMAEIKALGYGEVIAIDSDGNVLQPQSQKLDVEGGKN
ncbi:M16 family metallopeptidase [Marinoscillum luteum]|uniref:M16 family metallopeptidase n=1 Tax=Marinoscillum luteum TaxID=861051 RepID=A0ABW7N5N5_9BACT